MKVAFGQELLDFVDGDRCIDLTSRTGFFTELVADTSADRRERVLALDQCQRFFIAAFLGHLQIALYRNVCRAGCLTGRRSGLVGIHTSGIAIVLIPGIFAPADLIREDGLGIFHFLAVFRLQLLAKTDRTGRTDLYAAVAGDTLFLVDFRGIGALGKVAGVEKQGSSECIADLHITVADIKNMIGTIDVGGLMYIAVLFGLFQDLQRLFLGDVMGSSGLYSVVGHIAHLDTPVIYIVCTAFSQFGPGIAAGTDTGRQMSFVFLQPVGDLFQVQGFVMHCHFLFYRNDMHTDSVAAGTHHGGDILQRQESHPFKEGSYRRIFVDPVHR